MVHVGNVLFCVVCAVAFWTAIGFPIAIRLFGHWHSWLFAPALGWAVSTVVALPLFEFTGMARRTVLIFAFAGVLGALLATSLSGTVRVVRIPAMLTLSVMAAACLALIPLVGVLPKLTVDGITLASPIFDHSKIAMIDEMIRSGVPTQNAFFYEPGAPNRVAYYYLWHFSAAVAAIGTGISGWEADAALTGFSALSSLLLIIGLAMRSGARPWAGLIIVPLAASASLRTTLEWGWPKSASIIGEQSGFGAWLFQTSWAPQHVASAMCIVLLAILIPRLAEQPSWPRAVLLGLIGAAAFQSSVWVGGFVLILAAPAIGLLQLWAVPSRTRWPFVRNGAIAAGVAGLLAIPFIYDQAVSASLRGQSALLAFMPVAVLGDGWSAGLRRLLDPPAYWIAYLPIEFPAFYLSGLLGIGALTIGQRLENTDRWTIRALSLLAAISLITAWLAASVIGDNNDLGWRAVLPAVLVLIGFAGTLISHWPKTWSRLAGALAALGIAFSMPATLKIARENLYGLRKPSESQFSNAPELWQAVQRHTAVDERVGNNPLFLADMTPWPVNISWALMANRRSCYGGSELAIPFAAIPASRRAAIEALFVRVFAGFPASDDVRQLAEHFRCDTVVVTPQDGAWRRDPFAAGDVYRLVDSQADRWRIYRKTATPPAN